MNFSKQELKFQKNGITLIALVVTIVVLLILASVSITVVFGDNGILQLAKEAGEKTNEAVKSDLQDIQNLTTDLNTLMNNWDISKVTAVTTKDGVVVPVPKGFVGSEADGENTIKDGFVIYEGTQPVTNENLEEAKTSKNQFVWVPVDGVNLQYEQIGDSWKSQQGYGSGFFNGWTDNDRIEFRKQSVKKYGGFYVGRYEAGFPKKYDNEDPYVANEETRNTSVGTPVVQKGFQAWNYINQSNAKTLSENMYTGNDALESRLIDSYAWDTICTWLGKDNEFDILNSISWGNYGDNEEEYTINGLYALHEYYVENGVWLSNIASTFGKGIYNVSTNRTVEEVHQDLIELSTGISERNKSKNIYDLAGNMEEWTTEVRDNPSEGMLRGGGFNHCGDSTGVAWYYKRDLSVCRLTTRFSSSIIFKIT